jgi:DNA repair photolyase
MGRFGGLINKGISAFDEICKMCGACDGGHCFSLQGEAERVQEFPAVVPQNYTGYRFTADAMDCALPIALDSSSGCTYSCLYCFANNLQRAPDRNAAKVKKSIVEGSVYSQWSIKRLEALLDHTLKDSVAKAMYPVLDSGMPVQFGALGEPFDDLEAYTGWMKKAVPIFIKHNLPVRISTKGATTMLRPEYIKLFEDRPDLFWFAFSIICNSDDLISKVDIKAPVTSKRLEAMKVYSKLGCSTSLRFRPFLPGISDAYPGEPMAWAKLIERSAEAGAKAVSFEWIFLNSSPTERQKAMYRLIMRAMNNMKFVDQWNSMSEAKESCRRGNRDYKYEITVAVRKKVHELGMTFGVSDPHFKELNDTGCCCGIKPDDPVFGKWSRRQMTNVVYELAKAYREGKPRTITYLDWAPEWAHQVHAVDMYALSGWHEHRRKKFMTFGDSMRNKWNDPIKARGPFHYFGGILHPVRVDKKTRDVVYEYRPWREGKAEKE